MQFTKKLTFLLLAFLLFLSPFVCATNEAVASTPQTTNETIKVFNTDLYLGDQDVVVSDAVNGNVFAFGSTVTIN